jgi:hypothetical protein
MPFLSSILTDDSSSLISSCFFFCNDGLTGISGKSVIIFFAYGFSTADLGFSSSITLISSGSLFTCSSGSSFFSSIAAASACFALP